MTEYIKREDAIKAVCDSCSPHSCNREDCELGCQAASAIMALQAADVIETDSLQSFLTKLSLFCSFLTEKSRQAQGKEPAP